MPTLYDTDTEGTDAPSSIGRVRNPPPLFHERPPEVPEEEPPKPPVLRHAPPVESPLTEQDITDRLARVTALTGGGQFATRRPPTVTPKVEPVGGRFSVRVPQAGGGETTRYFDTQEEADVFASQNQTLANSLPFAGQEPSPLPKSGGIGGNILSGLEAFGSSLARPVTRLQPFSNIPGARRFAGTVYNPVETEPTNLGGVIGKTAAGFLGAGEVQRPEDLTNPLSAVFLAPGARGLAGLGAGFEAASALKPVAQIGLPATQAVGGHLLASERGALGKVPKEPWQMNIDEVRAARIAAQEAEKNSTERVFGKEGAKQYNAAQRTANSANASPDRIKAADQLIKKMEDRLSPEQERILFGIGEPGLSADELRGIEHAMSSLDWESPQSLGASLRFAITKVAPTTDPSTLRGAELESYMSIKHAFQKATELGWDTKVISDAALEGAASRFKDPEDVQLMLRSFARAAPAKAEGAKALPPARMTSIGEQVPFTPSPESAFVRAPEATEQETIAKLTALIRSAKPVRTETEFLKSAERSQRVAKAAKVLEQKQGKQAFEESKKFLGGELPKAKFTPPEQAMAADEINGLYDTIRTSEQLYFQRLNTSTALTKVLSGQLPTEGEITLLEKQFGTEFAKAILSKKSLGEKAFREFMDGLGLTRVFITAWDASAPFRQGVIMAPSHPKEFFGNFVPMFRAMADSNYAKAVDTSLTVGTKAARYEKYGLYIAPSQGVSISLGKMEEAFMSRLAQKIPGIAQSQRAYTTFLNKLRADTFDNVVQGWASSGKQVADADIARLADSINIFTGRGNLGALQRAAPMLNTAFFAPRLVAARFETPVIGARSLAQLMRADASPADKEILKTLVAFTGTGVGILSLLKLSGQADVELDPRSSDFGKFRLGQTRFDFWGGFNPAARLIVQLATNERKELKSGEITDLNRLGTLGRFAQSKLSPQVGAAVDLLSGQTFFGEELHPNAETAKTQLYQRLTPLYIQDTVDAIREHGVEGGFIAAPAGLGVGVQTFNTAADKMVGRAQRYGWTQPDGSSIERYSDLSPSQIVQLKQEPDIKSLLESGAAKNPYAAIDARRLTGERDAGEAFRSGQITGPQFRESFYSAQAEAAIRRDEQSIGRKAPTRPDDPFKAALFDYYQAFKDNKLPGVTDFEKLESRLAELEAAWTPEIKKYVEANTGLTQHDDPTAREFDALRKKLRAANYWEPWKVLDEYKSDPHHYDAYVDYLRVRDIPHYTYDAAGNTVVSPQWVRWFQAGGDYKAMQRLDKIMERAKLYIRQQNPDIEKGIVTFYGDTPLEKRK